MKRGVLLFNLGGPERLSDVRPFLYNLFSDPEIVRLPFPALQKPLAWLISTTRYRKSAGYYSQIGGGSPLRRITDEQASALALELESRGVEASVYVAMRYWAPSTSDALQRIVADEITDLVVLPLYPQYSVSTTGSSLKEFLGQVEALGGLKNVRRRYITRWHLNRAYLEALAELITRELPRFPDPAPERVHLLFSAHGVPESYISRGDPYLRHTEETVTRVSDLVGKKFPVHLSFQSKVGPVKWLAPSTDEKLRQLRRAGVEQVLVIPVSFVSDHIETLYELDILYRRVAEEVGIRYYRRVPAFNCEPPFIRALADLVTSRFHQSLTSSTEMKDELSD
jgi:protoporphyrin/coproporphyrin ferrochelatase